MGKQRNTLQRKEQENYPAEEINEMKKRNLSEAILKGSFMVCVPWFSETEEINETQLMNVLKTAKFHISM